MPRKLKYHEQRLLRKVSFANYSGENTKFELGVIKKFHLKNREEYHKYEKMAYTIRGLAHRIKKLETTDPFRLKMTELLLDKLYNCGILPTKQSLSQCDELGAASFCKRRLPVVMTRLKYAERVIDATRFIEQGHVRVGPETVNDPAFLVTRNMEDFVTWVDTSKIKKHVLKYNDALDDFDIL